MPLSLRWGHVTAITERLDGLVRCEVDGAPCVAYTRLTGPVEDGDTVIVNTQARELELGSGGFDVLYANLTRGLSLAAAEGAHVMALPYTPGQAAFRTGEEGRRYPDGLEAMPVVCCGLHSQLAPVCAALAGLRVAYVQLAGGALPVSLSDTVRALRARRLIEVAVAVAPVFRRRHRLRQRRVGPPAGEGEGRHVAVCAIGPGIVGTGTSFGHGGVAVADGGECGGGSRRSGGRGRRGSRTAILASATAESRTTRTTLSGSASASCGSPGRPTLPEATGTPLSRPSTSRAGSERCVGLPLSHMGRDASDDPWFFAAAFAARRARPRSSWARRLRRSPDQLVMIESRPERQRTGPAARTPGARVTAARIGGQPRERAASRAVARACTPEQRRCGADVRDRERAGHRAVLGDRPSRSRRAPAAAGPSAGSTSAASGSPKSPHASLEREDRRAHERAPRVEEPVDRAWARSSDG